jgi:hypothetical protein
MAYVTGDVVPSDDAEFPYKVVFKHGDAVIAEWLVESKEHGELEIIEGVKSLAEFEDDGEGDGEEDEDSDEEESDSGDGD